MSEGRATIMILVPGRNALSFAAPRAPTTTIIGALLLPLLTGLGAERCYRSLRGESASAAIASLARVPLSAATPTQHKPVSKRILPKLGNPEQPPDALATSRTILSHAGFEGLGQALHNPLSNAVTLTATIAPSTIDTSGVVSAKSILRAFSTQRRGSPSDTDLAQVPTNGWLRLQALHLDEELNVRPFDDSFRPNPEALAQIDHALRCRVTGAEVGIDPRLVAILVQLHTLYGRPIQLVSGHRTPNTIGTKKTSQHTLGRAADIRIAGVSIEELKRVAIKFGARGVGLYPEKGFVHVDVRQKNRYYWHYTAADGEQADMGTTRPAAAANAGVETAGAEPPSDSESEDDSE